ncbi:hypothetical protein [Alteromonas facilis]|uniref:hypothetical protein n=1 Tax=Alteromonas facilis TaxID=2048004 RepID=UPI000C292630|nr:hypothetical protein [Alteromonas facilis]
MQWMKINRPRRPFRRRRVVAAYLIITASNLMISDVQAQQVAGQDSRVIKLESTIRGDQQQPRVLSIVPWDSPAQKRVTRVALTGAGESQLAPLERNAFLQRIELHKRMLTQLSAQDAQKNN